MLATPGIELRGITMNKKSKPQNTRSAFAPLRLGVRQNPQALRFILLALFVLGLVSLPLTAAAQSPLSASVDRTTLTTDDTVTLSIVVNSQSGATARPELPPLDGFAVVGTNMSTQVSMVNGAVSASVAYDYRLQPTRTGDLTIGEVIATIDGVSYATNPITVQVTQGTGRPTGGANAVQVLPPGQLGQSDYFVEATVDNANPYVGQQVLYTVRFYQAADSSLMPSLFSSQPSYAAPNFTGFWSQSEEGAQKNYRVSAGGRVYNVSELNTLLFPTAAGDVTIDPAQIILPDSMFQRGGALQSEPVTVAVKPLPAGAPAGFNGAVGRYVMQAELDSAATDTDNPVTLNVTVTGQGNVSTAGDPVLPELDGWRVFPGKAEVKTAVQDGLLYGQRTYAHVLAATTTGDVAIPALEYVYFDPADGAYHTATTEPLAVRVTQGKLAPAAVPPAAAAGAPSGEQTAAAAAGAAPLALKPIVGPLQMAAAPLTTQPWYWLLWAMPLAALTGGFVWQRRQVHQQHHAAAIRSSRAGKAARKALAQARKTTDPVAQMAQVQTLLLDYLAAKLHQPVAGLTRPALAALLAAKQIDGALLDRVLACLDSVEALRFSPAKAEPAAVATLLDTVETTIVALDEAL
jgi:hypothetical protein